MTPVSADATPGRLFRPVGTEDYTADLLRMKITAASKLTQIHNSCLALPSWRPKKPPMN